MSKVLYIKASPKKDSESVTFKMSEAFIEEYKKNNPQDEVVTIDLYKEDVDFLTREDVEKMDRDVDCIVKRYAQEFRDADKYVFAAPFWNLSIPAILKAYLDYVFYVGVTFQYTENGPVGLLENKKAAYIVSRGGMYSGQASAYDFASQYLTGALGFLGVRSFITVTCQNTGVLSGEDLEKAIQDSIEEARIEAKTF